jgi:hypothetical protein
MIRQASVVYPNWLEGAARDDLLVAGLSERNCLADGNRGVFTQSNRMF